MTGILMFIHALVALVLIVIVLMQSGRGGGLTEGFGGAAESVFGAKTNEFMIKATAIAGTIFLVTSLTLAHLSSRADRSLMESAVPENMTIEVPVEKMPDLPKAVTSPETRAFDEVEEPVRSQKMQE
jgi:preprotein translocase subunit SecG